MHAYMSLVAIAGALIAGAISPGPSFLFVARNSIALSRKHGFATALGMGVGAFLYAVIALLGVHAIFVAVPWAFWGLKVIGGFYLIYLACCIIRSARVPISAVSGDGVPTISLSRAFASGLLTQMSNPKTAVVFAGVFSALLPKEYPTPFYVIIPAIAFTIDTTWYHIVAFLLSAESPRRAYLRFKTLIDRTAGGVMALLGLKLIIDSR